MIEHKILEYETVFSYVTKDEKIFQNFLQRFGK
jgi:hypothetical protein